MKKSITIRNLSEIQTAAREFLDMTKGHNLIAFYAPMGAGKTTFTAAICPHLGIRDDAVSSPTFSIVNEYKTSKRESVYHFDFYRIERLEEALDIGLYDYLDTGCMCIMEWPENIEDLLPEDTLKVYIRVNDDFSRTTTWEE